MPGRTFVEKIFDAPVGSIVFAKPDVILSHDNTASIEKTFNKMGFKQVKNPENLMVVLDHNAPPTTSNLANNYQQIRNFVHDQKVTRFHDSGDGICHQHMSKYARPGMIIVGSDSHTCTAGAFNAFAAGIDRTETAGLWTQGETWFRVPETMKIVLHGKLPDGVYSKDIALYIIGKTGANGADYRSVEFHGDGVKYLTISDRMTIANLASEMGAKNAVFPPDEVLNEFLGQENTGVWSDEDANYASMLEIKLDEIAPLIACPHQVENVKSVFEVAGTTVQQALIGTCTNGRIEDLRIAADVLQGKLIPPGFQLLIIPASREIYKQAINEGLIEIFINSGANILSPSCGPCLGTGQGIPADNTNVISTANRNFLGRMGNPKASVFLASPATVAYSALEGKIVVPLLFKGEKTEFKSSRKETRSTFIETAENRFSNGVWSYPDIDNLNTDQMFAGKLTYEINSSEPDKIVPHLFKDFDSSFSERVKKDDVIVCGENFGCGSSREHPSVGLAYVGIKLVLVKSVGRIFYRSAINQGLAILVLPEAVDAYKFGDSIEVRFEEGILKINERVFHFEPLPSKLMEIIKQGGLTKYIGK
ncbi:MAG: 3-isopropylmalate dehydratase large subunit, partial [Bacteroidales bacterium]|nr:3-isopropylmalate dehydratase large subunit [Bacteroidales bacterium]